MKIRVTGTYNDNKWVYDDYVETIEEAIKTDYRFWYKYKAELKFYYEGVLLERKVEEYVSFEEEIIFLKEQIGWIDENERERYKYEN